MANLPNNDRLNEEFFVSDFEQETSRLTSDCEIDDTFRVPDPGFARTWDESSDEEHVVDRDAPVRQKPFPSCSFIEFESLEDRLPSKRQKRS